MEKIKIITDEMDANIKASIPLPSLDSLSKPILSEVSSKIIKKNIKNTIDEILESLSEVKSNKSYAYIESIKFNLNINAKGEVALISLIKGSVGSSVGIEFTIKLKKD